MEFLREGYKEFVVVCEIVYDLVLRKKGRYKILPRVLSHFR